MDGTLGSSTAWMLDGSGMVLTSAAEMAEIARASAASGLSVAVHAIGDGANRAVLDALEETRAAWEELPVPPGSSTSSASTTPTWTPRRARRDRLDAARAPALGP